MSKSSLLPMFGMESPKEELVDFNGLLNPNNITEIYIGAIKSNIAPGGYRIWSSVKFSKDGAKFEQEFDHCGSLKEAFTKLFEFCSKL